MKPSMYAWSAAVVLTVGAAWAHEGPRVWLDQSGGRVITLTSDNDISPTTFTPSRVFVGQFGQLFGVWTTEFPGYEVRSIGPSVAEGTTFGFRLAGPLLKYDDSTDRVHPVHEIFGPTVPQLAVSLDATVAVTESGPRDGFDYFQYFGAGDHSHLSFTLLGDGISPTAPPPPDGAYVLPLINTGAGLLASDWYFIVFQKNATTTQRDRAASLASVMSGALPGDANFDGTVGIADFARLGSSFNAIGKWWGDGDFTFDATVNIADFSLLAANFNRPNDRAAAVPEPGAAAMLVVAGWVLKRRRAASR
jgi:hypothetical protein